MAGKADVIARGNQICQSAARAVRAVRPPGGGSLAALARYYKEVAPIVATEAKQLHELPRPARDRSLLNRYLAALANSADEFRALAAAARAGDSSTLASASAGLRVNPAASLAARYGIAECGASPATAAS